MLRMTLLKVIVLILSRFYENGEIFKGLIQTVGLFYLSFTVCSGDVEKISDNGQSTEKKVLKMTCQLVFPPSPSPKSDFPP